MVEHNSVKLDLTQKSRQQIQVADTQNDEDVNEALTDRVLVDKLPKNSNQTNLHKRPTPATTAN